MLCEILDLIKESTELRSHPAGIVGIKKIPCTNNGKNDISKLTEMYGEFKYK